jgi:hypothetical protein
MSTSSSSRHFYLLFFYLHFNRMFRKAVPTQDMTNPVRLPPFILHKMFLSALPLCATSSLHVYIHRHTHIYVYNLEMQYIYAYTVNIQANSGYDLNGTILCVVITEEYNVMVNCEELIGTTRICDVIDEVSHRPMSL